MTKKININQTEKILDDAEITYDFHRDDETAADWLIEGEKISGAVITHAYTNIGNYPQPLRDRAKRLQIAGACAEYERAMEMLDARKATLANMLNTNKVVRKVCKKYPAEMTDAELNRAAAEVAQLCNADWHFGYIMCMAVYGVRGHGKNTLKKARQEIARAEKKAFALAQCLIALL